MGNLIVINWWHTTITVINAEVCDSGLHGDLLLYNHMNKLQFPGCQFSSLWEKMGPRTKSCIFSNKKVL